MQTKLQNEVNTQNEHTLQSFTASKKTDLKCGDLVKILDDRGNPIEYGYLLKEPVKKNGVLLVNIKTQRTNKTVEMAITNAIQKI